MVRREELHPNGGYFLKSLSPNTASERKIPGVCTWSPNPNHNRVVTPKKTTYSPELVGMTTRAAKFGLFPEYQQVRQLAAPNIGSGRDPDVWAMAYRSPRPGIQPMSTINPLPVPQTAMSVGSKAAAYPPANNAAQMLHIALDTTDTALRLLEDGVAIRSGLEAAVDSSQGAEPIDLTCICPCCNKDFELTASHYATVDNSLENARADSKDLRQKMGHAREKHRLKIERELYEFSVSKLQKVMGAFHQAEAQFSDNQRSVTAPGRDAKKQQYLALYEELLQEKYELEMTTMMQQRLDGTSTADHRSTQDLKLVETEFKVVSLPAGTVTASSPVGTKVPAFSSRVDAHVMRTPTPRGDEYVAILSPREVTRLTPRRPSPRDVSDTLSQARSQEVPSLASRHPPHPMPPPRNSPVFSSRQLSRSVTPPRARTPPQALTPPQNYSVPLTRQPDWEVRPVVPLTSPRADPEIHLFKKLNLGEKMYPDFHYAGQESAPGFTPSERSGTNSPLFY